MDSSKIEGYDYSDNFHKDYSEMKSNFILCFWEQTISKSKISEIDIIASPLHNNDGKSDLKS